MCNDALFPINFFLLHAREVVAAERDIRERSLKRLKSAATEGKTTLRLFLVTYRCGRVG